jgi:DNA-binding response OmpR family regulator
MAAGVVLLIEDDDNDRELFTRLIGRNAWSVESARTLDEGLGRLAKGLSGVVLLDLGLPDAAGTSGLRQLARRYPELPIVVLTALDDEAIGLQAVRDGAQDYLVKGQVDGKLLDRSLRYAMERKRAESAMARLAAITSALCDECGRKVAATRPFDRRS